MTCFEWFLSKISLSCDSRIDSNNGDNAANGPNIQLFIHDISSDYRFCSSRNLGLIFLPNVVPLIHSS